MRDQTLFFQGHWNWQYLSARSCGVQSQPIFKYLVTISQSEFMAGCVDEMLCMSFQGESHWQHLLHAPTYRPAMWATHPITNRRLKSGLGEVCTKASAPLPGFVRAQGQQGTCLLQEQLYRWRWSQPWGCKGSCWGEAGGEGFIFCNQQRGFCFRKVYYFGGYEYWELAGSMEMESVSHE